MIRTERLVIRPLVLSDTDALLPYHSDPEVVRYIPWTVRDRVEVMAYIKRVATAFDPTTQGSYLMMGFTRSDDDTVIGQVNAGMESVADNHASIGWVINPEYSGQGFTTEAVRGLLAFLIDEFGIRRFTAKIDQRNDGSIELAKRLGMRLEATYVEDEFFKGEWVSTCLYAILDREVQR